MRGPRFWDDNDNDSNNNNNNNNNNNMPNTGKRTAHKKHDRVCAQLLFRICKETEVQLDKKNISMNMCQNQEKQVKKAR